MFIGSYVCISAIKIDLSRKLYSLLTNINLRKYERLYKFSEPLLVVKCVT